MIARKVGAALAAGCTMVIKPVSQTPFSALAMMELAIRAGIPVGVVDVVTVTATEIGEEFTSNPIVRKLPFTGSTDTGRKLMVACAHDIKKLSLELGATPLSSSLKTPIWMLPLRARWSQNIATMARPVCVRIVCIFRRVSTMSLRKNFRQP